MEPSITYSVNSINWNPDNPLVISDVSCSILVELEGKQFTQGFGTILEFLDPADPTFINIREMLESGQKEETFPYLVEFAKQSLNAKGSLPLTDEELLEINTHLDGVVQNMMEEGLDTIEIEKRRSSIFNSLSKTYRLTTQHLEEVAIEQLQFMLNDKSEELTTVF